MAVRIYFYLKLSLILCASVKVLNQIKVYKFLTECKVACITGVVDVLYILVMLCTLTIPNTDSKLFDKTFSILLKNRIFGMGTKVNKKPRLKKDYFAVLSLSLITKSGGGYLAKPLCLRNCPVLKE